MRSHRVRDVVVLFLVATVSLSSHAGAVDHLVEFRCILDSVEAHFEIVPSRVVVVAGTDRILFRTYGDVLPCMRATHSLNLELRLWDQLVWLWNATPPQGPFCESGTRSYTVGLRGSHGETTGSFGPGTIEVVPAGGGDVTPSVTIGIFAEPAAATCILPVSPGSQRAYVCARLEGEAGRLTLAEFRVDGFPADWNVTAVPVLPNIHMAGDPLGAGVRIASFDCSSGSSDVVVLYQLNYVVSSVPSNRIVEVHAANLPGRTRPRINLCIGQAIREPCARGGVAYLSRASPSCEVTVQRATWAQIRTFYR